MEHFRAATSDTPQLSFDLDNGFISISGVSTKINGIDFYKNVIDGLSSFKSEKKEIILDLSLEYFNTSTAKYIYDILIELKNRMIKGFSVLVNWFYDHNDQDMLEMGRDYSELTELDFKFHKIESNLLHN